MRGYHAKPCLAIPAPTPPGFVLLLDLTLELTDIEVFFQAISCMVRTHAVPELQAMPEQSLLQTCGRRWFQASIGFDLALMWLWQHRPADVSLLPHYCRGCGRRCSRRCSWCRKQRLWASSPLARTSMVRLGRERDPIRRRFQALCLCAHPYWVELAQIGHLLRVFRNEAEFATALPAVHELGHTEMPKAVVLHGDRDYSAAVTSSMLGLGPGSGQR